VATPFWHFPLALGRNTPPGNSGACSGFSTKENSLLKILSSSNIEISKEIDRERVRHMGHSQTHLLSVKWERQRMADAFSIKKCPDKIELPVQAALVKTHMSRKSQQEIMRALN